MKIELDENILARLTSILGRLGHEVDTVKSEGPAGRDDATVWEEAQRTRRFLITQDLDFSDVRRYAPGGHDSLLLLRLRDPGRNALLRRIQTPFES